MRANALGVQSRYKAVLSSPCCNSSRQQDKGRKQHLRRRSSIKEEGGRTNGTSVRRPRPLEIVSEVMERSGRIFAHVRRERADELDVSSDVMRGKKPSSKSGLKGPLTLCEEAYLDGQVKQ